MKKFILIVVIIALSLLVCGIANANEKIAVPQQSFNFFGSTDSLDGTNLNLGVTKYAMTNEQKITIFHNMFIAGLVLTIVGGVFFVTGIILLAVGYSMIYASLAGGAFVYTAGGTIAGGWYVYWAGAALLGIFTTVLVIGIALLVVGIVLENYFKKKGAFFFQKDEITPSTSFGISIKL
jgi:hypothetical protein